MKRLLAVGLSVPFLVLGAGKLVGVPVMVTRFAALRLAPWWLMYLVGTVEVVGALLMLNAASRRVGAWGLGALTLLLGFTQLRQGLWIEAATSALLAWGLWGLISTRPQSPAES